MMRNRLPKLLWGILFFCAGLVGCRNDDMGAVLQGVSLDVTMPAFPSDPVTVPAGEILANPSAYAGNLLQLTGQFHRAPLLICDDIIRPSPAQWALNDGSGVLLGGGLTPELLTLAPDGLTVTVEGRWRFWRGYVGCGKDEKLTEFYYLANAHLLAPNPLTMATLTPSGFEPTATPLDTGVGTPIVAVPPTPTRIPTSLPLPTSPPVEPTQVPLPTFTPPIAPPTPTAPPVLPSNTPPSPPTNVPASPTAENSATPISTELPSETETPDPNVMTTTPTVEGVTETPEATQTVDPNITPTETATGEVTPTETPTPSPTITPDGTPILTITPSVTPDPNVIVQDTIESQELVMEEIGADEIHVWLYEVAVSDVLTINVSTYINLDMIVTVQEPNGDEIIIQDSAQAGQPEILVAVDLPEPGAYRIVLSEKDGDAGMYSMILQGKGAYAFLFRGTIGYDDSVTSPLNDHTDHFWHFKGDMGDSVTIEITPNDASDLFLELYGIDAERLEDVDTGGSGDAETLSYTLPADGLYAIRVGEFNFDLANYTLTLTKN